MTIDSGRQSQKDAESVVAVINAGGTIGKLIGNPVSRSGSQPGAEVRLPASELIDVVSGILPRNLHLIPADFISVQSGALTQTDWLTLNELIHRLTEDEDHLDGVVVTHGTATLEETAFFLNLTLSIEIPVVVVGAMRPLDALGTDASLNLVNAILVAASPSCKGLGVLVSLNGEIHCARDVTKSSTQALEAFVSRDLGIVGYVEPTGEVSIYRSPTRRHAPDAIADVRGLSALPRVDIAYSYIGADGIAIDAFISHGARGIVSCGIGSGYPTPGERRSLIEAYKSGIIIVQSSRAGRGRVIHSHVLPDCEVIISDGLSAQKARILTMLALTQTDEPSTIQSLFLQY